MATNNANITITGDVRSAISQLSLLNQSVSSINKSLAETQNELKLTESRWKRYSDKINSYAMLAKNAYGLVNVAINGVKSAMDFGKEMSSFESVQKSFKTYADTVGTNSDNLLNKLKTASGGVIDNLRLMQSASNAMAKGVTNSADKMADLMMVANQKAKIFGKEGGQVFDELVNAISKGSEKALAEVGIKLPDGFDKMTNDMTKAEKQAKILELVIESGKKEIKAMGGELVDSSDSFARFDTAMKNLKTSAGTMLLPALSSIAEALATIINQTEDVILGFKEIFKNKPEINYSAATSKTLQLFKTKNADRLSEINTRLNQVINDLKLEREKDSPENRKKLLSQYEMTEGGGHSYQGESLLDAKKIINLKKEEKELSEEKLKLEKELKELDERLGPILEREKAVREGINFTIKNGNADLDETNTKTKTTSTNVNSIISKIDTLAKDKLPKLPETTSEMLDVSTEVLSVASLMPNYWFKTGENIDEVNKKLEEQNKLLAEKEFKKRSEEIGYWNSFIRADNKTQQNSLYNNFFKQAGVVMPSDIDYVKIINNASTRQDINETADYLQKQFTDGISNAIADGFASADFSGFASSLQSVISGVVGSGISSSLSEALTKKSSGNLGGLFKEVVTTDKSSGKTSLSLGALGSNLLVGAGISAATNFLFGEGGIFGKTKIVGKENLNKSAELNAQVDQAKELAESIYLATGISDATRELIDNAVYNKTWTTTSKSKNIFKKKKTISLHGAAEAQASIKYVEDLQKQALGEQALNNYNNYMLGRDNSVAASYNSYLDAQKAYDASQVMLYSDEENAGFKSDLKAKQARIKELNSYKTDSKKAYKNGYGYYYYNNYSRNPYHSNTAQINNEINTLNSEIASLREKLNSSYKYDLETRTEMLQQMEEAHTNYIKAQQDARTNLLSNFTNSTTLASLAGSSSSSAMDMLLGNRDVMGNSDMVQTMLPLLEESYMKDADLNKRLNSSNDSVREAAVKEQQSIWEQASNVYEKMYKDAKDEALNTDLSTEERSAAFERWQETFQAYLSLQEQIAENTKTIADIEESNALSKLSTELGDMLSIVAEIKNQKSTNNTMVFRQSLSEEEIIAKLKEVAGAKNPELASVLGEILNDKANASIWG